MHAWSRECGYALVPLAECGCIELELFLDGKLISMTVTLNLPPNIEQDFIGEAASRGLTPDEFFSEVLLARAAWRHGSESNGTTPCSALLQMEEGVPVLSTGQPMALQAINDTLERVRLERDLGNFGSL